MTSTSFTIPKVRHKKRHSKTRTGCSTCKRRHFKCDERKPECLRCMVDGKECIYNVPETKLFPPPRADHSEVIPRSLQVAPIQDPLEQRALSYFKERTISDLTGFTTYTRAFWNSVIPGLSEAEPAIRHLAIALSSQHEARHSEADKVDEINCFCFKHHSLALQMLSRSSPAQKEEVLLVSCIAFITFERFRDLDGRAGHYLDYAIAGLKILREREQIRRSVGNGAFNLVDDFIEPMLFQIELVFSMFCEPQRLMMNETPAADIQAPNIPAELEDTNAASDAIFQIILWRYIILHRGQVWSKTSSSFPTVMSMLERWDQSVTRLQSRLSDNHVEEYHRAAALKRNMQVLTGAILYSVREDIPPQTLCRPALVYVSLQNKITIFTSIDKNRKINLSGLNGTLYPWPHAKRVGGLNGDNFVSLEFTTTGTAS